MKRRIVGIALMLCYLLSAFGCTKPENSEVPLGIAIEEGYSYGNMQKNTPSGNFMPYGGGIAFYVNTHGLPRLYTYDIQTGKVSLFTKDATDLSGITLSGNLESYGGKLYALSGDSVAELKGEQLESIRISGAQTFWHSQGKLYVKTKDASLIVYEDGAKPRMILDEFTGYWDVVYGQYLYYNWADSIFRIDLAAEAPQEEVVVADGAGIADGSHIYYTDAKTCRLYRCNMDGSGAALLLDEPVLTASLNFDGEYVYFRRFTDLTLEAGAGCCDLYRFPKADPAQTEKIAELPLPVFTVYTVPGCEKIFVVTLGALQENGNRESWPVYVMNRDGSGMKLLEIPDF